jgi:hypothetical protein
MKITASEQAYDLDKEEEEYYCLLGYYFAFLHISTKV